jgi:hypothetical protein
MDGVIESAGETIDAGVQMSFDDYMIWFHDHIVSLESPLQVTQHITI